LFPNAQRAPLSHQQQQCDVGGLCYNTVCLVRGITAGIQLINTLKPSGRSISRQVVTLKNWV